MRRIIALSVSFYWMAFFALMGLAAMAETTGEVFAIFQALSFAGDPAAGAPGAGPVLSVTLAFGFTLASVLFLWTLVTALAQAGHQRSDADEICRAAFGSGAGIMAVLLVVGVVLSVPNLFASASLQVLALLVSYLAVHAEQRRSTHGAEGLTADAEISARVMAIGAAHHTMLSRVSGRPGTTGEGS